MRSIDRDILFNASEIILFRYQKAGSFAACERAIIRQRGHVRVGRSIVFSEYVLFFSGEDRVFMFDNGKPW
jgi:hypothetical protein